MPRFYFSVAGMENADIEGQELPTEEAVRAHAMKVVREISKESALVGCECSDWVMVVTDDDENIVFRLRFAQLPYYAASRNTRTCTCYIVPDLRHCRRQRAGGIPQRGQAF